MTRDASMNHNITQLPGKLLKIVQCFTILSLKLGEETASTCSAGLLRAGGTDELAETPEPDKISLRVPLIPRRSKVLDPRGDPLANVDSSRIKPCMPQVSSQTTSLKIQYH